MDPFVGNTRHSHLRQKSYVLLLLALFFISNYRRLDLSAEKSWRSRRGFSFILLDSSNSLFLERNAEVTRGRRHDLAVDIPLAKISSQDMGEVQDLPRYISNYGPVSYGPSRLAEEIDSITHNPSRAEIVIKLKPPGSERQCVDPFVFGRLSGPFLTMINWEKVKSNDSDVVDRIIGHYSVPLSGRYFLEIIGILCNDFAFDADFRNQCLEDPTQHRITHDAAFIDVVHGGETQRRDGMQLKEKDLDGYWKWVPDRSGNTSAPVPLYTRYQPRYCGLEWNERVVMKGEDPERTRCGDPMTLDRFNPYRFVFTGGKEVIRSRVELLEGNVAGTNSTEQTRLCVVGASHAREMANTIDQWLSSWNLSDAISVHLAPTLFPRDIDDEFIQEHIINAKCHKTVIANGQWSAGKKPTGQNVRATWGDPSRWESEATLFPEYKLEVREMISRLKGAGVVDFFLRSIHYNSLGDIKTECPPTDWRSPPTLDVYNAIIKDLAKDMEVPYIDT